MKNKLLFLLSETGINDVFNSGVTTAQSISQSWDNQWINLLQSNASDNIYRSLTTLGIFFAVGTLLFFMIQWLRDAIYSEFSRPLSALIWPFIVVLLLTNMGSGSMLSNLTLGVRNFLNTINQQIVTTANGNQTYQQVLNMSVAEEFAGSLFRPCSALVGEQQQQCFIKANEKMQGLWQQYRNLYGNQPWISRLEIKANQITYNTGSVSDTSFNALLGSTLQTSIKNFLISLQYAFQNLIEATMLLIAVLGPIAVGSSLLPIAGKPIFAWIIGFFALGIAKMSFNIMAIITATVIINGPGQDMNTDPDLMWFMIFLGILAPMVSLALSAIAGWAIFSAISQTHFNLSKF
jgi:hypothetical protein